MNFTVNIHFVCVVAVTFCNGQNIKVVAMPTSTALAYDVTSRSEKSDSTIIIL